MRKRKRAVRAIEIEDRVFVQREVDAPWESAVYRGRVAQQRGWHRVELASPRLVDIAGVLTPIYVTIVPSRRLRRPTDAETVRS